MTIEHNAGQSQTAESETQQQREERLAREQKQADETKVRLVVEDMIQRAVKYKPKKGLKQEEKDKHEKPRKGTNSWALYHKMILFKERNPHFEKALLESRSIRYCLMYATDYLKARWPELEVVLLEILKANFKETPVEEAGADYWAEYVNDLNLDELEEVEEIIDAKVFEIKHEQIDIETKKNEIKEESIRAESRVYSRLSEEEKTKYTELSIGRDKWNLIFEITNIYFKKRDGTASKKFKEKAKYIVKNAFDFFIEYMTVHFEYIDKTINNSARKAFLYVKRATTFFNLSCNFNLETILNLFDKEELVYFSEKLWPLMRRLTEVVFEQGTSGSVPISGEERTEKFEEMGTRNGWLESIKNYLEKTDQKEKIEELFELVIRHPRSMPELVLSGLKRLDKKIPESIEEELFAGISNFFAEAKLKDQRKIEEHSRRYSWSTGYTHHVDGVACVFSSWDRMYEEKVLFTELIDYMVDVKKARIVQLEKMIVDLANWFMASEYAKALKQIKQGEKYESSKEVSEQD